MAIGHLILAHSLESGCNGPIKILFRQGFACSLHITSVICWGNSVITPNGPVMGRGNPRVWEAVPYPYPWKPLPVRVKGFEGSRGLETPEGFWEASSKKLN